MRSVELFGGAGGLAMGMASAGFKHDAVVEWDKEACFTIRENQKLHVKPMVDWPLFETDVRKFDYSKIPSGLDVLAGGPPCQPFSIGGKHRGSQDDRNMFPEAVRGVRELRPRAFIFENVRGLTRQSFATYFEYIKLQLSYPTIARKTDEIWEDHLARLQQVHTSSPHRGLRYNVVAGILNAVNFGIPQKRDRVFIVGFRSDLDVKWSFPTPTHSAESLFWSQWVTGDYWKTHGVSKRQRPKLTDAIKKKVLRIEDKDAPVLPRWQTVRDAIAGLPDPIYKTDSHITNHKFQPGARSYKGHTGSPLDEPSKTLKAGDHGVPGGENMLALPNGDVRYFTIRESARIQTFPDEMFFPSSWTETMRQLGNAVPKKLGEVVARAVHESLTNLSS